MPQDSFDPLDPSVACHPVLPANVPVDVVYYTTIVPIAVIPVGDGVPELRYPTHIVMRDVFRTVRVQSPAHEAALRSVAAGTPAFAPAWAAVPLETSPAPAAVRVASLADLLEARRVSAGTRTLPVDLDVQAIARLAEGRSAQVPARLPDSGQLVELVLQPDYALPNGDYAVKLDAAGRADLLRTRQVQVARVGQKTVTLDAQAIRQFLETGEATVKFAGNARASLTLLAAESVASTPARRTTRRPAADQGAVAMVLNVADRHAAPMRARSAAAPLVASNAPPPPPPPPPPPGTARVPQFPLVLHIPYRQEWTLNGYARGALLNTLSLAPQEETTIEVVSYDRRKRESESTVAFERETLREATMNNRDSTEAVDEARRESGWKLDVSANVSVPGVPVSGGPNFGIKDELVETAKTTASQISDTTEKASSRLKATRQTKVVETSELGTENKVVRHIRNPNLGRTLNLDAFEVVAHYGVGTRVEMDGVRVGVLVELYDFLGPMLVRGPGQIAALLSFEHVLAPNVPETVRPGFAAARLLLAAQRVCDYACAPPCPCLAEPATPGGSATPTETLQARLGQAMAAVQQAIGTLEQAGVEHLGRTIQQYWDHVLDPVHQPPASQWDAGRLEVRRYLYRRFVLDGPAQRFWAAAGTFNRVRPPTEAAARNLIAARGLQASDVLNAIAAFITMQLRVVGELAAIIGSGWPLVAPDMLLNGLGFDDAGLEVALNDLDGVLKELNAAQAAQPAPAEDAAPAQPAEEKVYADKDLAEASIDFDVLINHLGNNANFYRGVLWRSIDPADRQRFLGIYGNLGTLLTGRILGFQGTCAVLELDLRRDAAIAAWYAANVEQNQDLRDFRSSYQTILPTPGVTLEARLGVCDALEPHLVSARAVELDRAEAQALQEQHEATRRERRLAASLLDDPKPAGGIVVVERTPPSP